MRLFEIISKQLDPDLYEELDPAVIVKVAKNIVPAIEVDYDENGDGSVQFDTSNGLHLCIGCSVAEGSISINLSAAAGRNISSGTNKGAVTAIIKGTYDAAVRVYGHPSEQGSLNCVTDAGHGVWQHIAAKLGLHFSAINTR